MENLVQLDEERWQASENINHMQLLKKENWDDKRKLKSICEGDLICGCLKQLESREVNLSYLGRVLILLSQPYFGQVWG
jgi:hypothetical protein